MRHILAILIATALTLDATGARARGLRRIAAPMVMDEVSISFFPLASETSLSGGGVTGVIDVGRITHQPSRGRVSGSATKVQIVGVRVDGQGRSMQGTATLRAYLHDVDPRYSVRIDGITLGSSAALIDSHAGIGAVVPHRIEIDVPVNAPEGLLAASITWDVTTN